MCTKFLVGTGCMKARDICEDSEIFVALSLGQCSKIIRRHDINLCYELTYVDMSK